MARLDYTEVPYVSGDKSIIRTLFSRSRTNHSRLAVFGTSLETHPGGYGDNTIPRLNANAYCTFGAPSESLVAFPENEAGRFGVRTADFSATEDPSDYEGDLLAETKMQDTAGTTYYLNPLFKLQRTAVDTTLAVTSAGKQRYYIFDQEIKCELFVVAHAGSPPMARYMWHPAAAEASVVNAATNLDAQANFTQGSDYSALAAGTWVKETSPALTQDASYPHPQITIAGRVGADNAIGEGLRVGGLRWLCNPDTPRGMAINSFAAGGARISSFRTAYDGAYAQFQAFGPWTAIVLAFGINDIGSEGITADAYKTALSDYITYLRSSPWNQQGVPIILLSQLAVDPSLTSSSWGAATHADYRLIPAVHAEVASEFADVVAVNERRAMAEAGYDPSDSTHSSDGVHPTDSAGYWATLRADKIWQIMTESAAERLAGQVGSIASTSIQSVDVQGRRSIQAIGR